MADNRYTDYLRQPREFDQDLCRSLCVNPSQKLIYFKPGRAAGTSIFRRILQPMGGWIIQKDNPKEFNEWLQRITDDEFGTYFAFIFVRNPHERLVSAWYGIDRPKYPDFKQFVLEGVFDDNGNPKRLHYQQQSSLFEIPDQTRGHLSFAGKVENIQPDWKCLCEHTGIPHRPIVPSAVSDHKPYLEYYDAKTYQLVSEMYARDIELFGYSTLSQESI